MGWSRQDKPVDRILKGVDRELARVRRQRKLIERQDDTVDEKGSRDSGGTPEFVRSMLQRPKRVVEPTYRVSDGIVVDVAPNLAREWEPHERELPKSRQAAADAPLSPRLDEESGGTSKLVRYLSAGSLRRYSGSEKGGISQGGSRWMIWTWVGLGAVVVVGIYLASR